MRLSLPIRSLLLPIRIVAIPFVVVVSLILVLIGEMEKADYLWDIWLEWGNK